MENEKALGIPEKALEDVRKISGSFGSYWNKTNSNVDRVYCIRPISMADVERLNKDLDEFKERALEFAELLTKSIESVVDEILKNLEEVKDDKS